jgi:AhpD family alkylhydroperoxidase
MLEELTMEPRVDIKKHYGKLRGMFTLEQTVRESGLELSLIHLVKMRASLINGCAYCIDMHSKDARSEGETEQRLYGLGAWHETPFYTPRERAALEWTDHLTQIATKNAPDEVFERVREQFSEDELVALTMTVMAINAWNRWAISMRAVPGSYQVPEKSATHAAAQGAAQHA